MTAPAATAAYQELAAAIRGDLTMPADPGYDHLAPDGGGQLLISSGGG